MTTLLNRSITLEEAQELIKNGADVNEQDEHGNTPLFYLKKMEVAKLLIENGADVNIKNMKGQIPLHFSRDIDHIKLLINFGSDVHAKDEIGYIPLYYHLHYQYVQSITKEALVEMAANAKINFNIKSQDGTLLSILNRFGIVDPFIAKSLIEHGAIASEIRTYQKFRDLFSEKQKEVFDSFILLTSDDHHFFEMCLAYQESVRNEVKINIKEMDII